MPSHPSSDPAKEEARLRERLKAKSAANRRSRERSRSRERRSSSMERYPRHHHRDRHYDRRPSPPRYHHDRRRHPEHYRRGGPPPRGDYHHRLDHHGHYDSYHSRDHYYRDDEYGRRRRSRSPPRRSHEDRYRSSSESSRSSSVSSRSVEERTEQEINESSLTRDQRTVFVSQLVMRATERDLAKYFKKDHQIAIVDIQMLRDRGSSQHKGQAYVELRHLDDLDRTVALSDQVPPFQRFPLLIKASQAEKNYTQGSFTVTAMQMGVTLPAGRLEAGQEVQKVYVGNLDATTKAEYLFAVFLPFGSLERVVLQVEATTGASKGFCFLSYHDPKDANLAIQTMANQNLQGKSIKTGWASQTVPGVKMVTSEEFPADATVRAQKGLQALAQLNRGVPASQLLVNVKPPSLEPVTVSVPPPQVSAVVDATQIGRADRPSRHILVRNMFDKDKETQEGWWEEIDVEFRNECGQFGLIDVHVMHMEAGGKIYASFDGLAGAANCAKTLAGRWFDKRQLRVEYVDEDQIEK